MLSVLLIGAAALATIILIILNWDRIWDWFNGREKMTMEDLTKISPKIDDLVKKGQYNKVKRNFTFVEKAPNGKYNTIQGILNKETNDVLDGVKYESKEIDEEGTRIHRGAKLAFYD